MLRRSLRRPRGWGDIHRDWVLLLVVAEVSLPELNLRLPMSRRTRCPRLLTSSDHFMEEMLKQEPLSPLPCHSLFPPLGQRPVAFSSGKSTS